MVLKPKVRRNWRRCEPTVTTGASRSAQSSATWRASTLRDGRPRRSALATRVRPKGRKHRSCPKLFTVKIAITYKEQAPDLASS